jgi:SAM-dependent methyltransferase
MILGAVDVVDLDSWTIEWARSLDVAADAWRPELEPLIDRLGAVPGRSVVDVGCGSGRITGWLADRVGPDGLVCAVDREAEALEYAAVALSANPRRSVEGWVADIVALPFADDTFDAAWCSRVLGYLADPAAAIDELVRVVRPGGRIVVLTGDAARATFLPIEPELETRLRQAEHRALRAGAWGEPIDIHLGRRLYALARSRPVASVEPVSIVWERVAPLRDVDRTYLRAILAWLVDPASRRWLRRDWDECHRLFHPDSDACLIDRPDLHVVQTATAVVITV